jgi:hypothetical protein
MEVRVVVLLGKLCGQRCWMGAAGAGLAGLGMCLHAYWPFRVIPQETRAPWKRRLLYDTRLVEHCEAEH